MRRRRAPNSTIVASSDGAERPALRIEAARFVIRRTLSSSAGRRRTRTSAVYPRRTLEKRRAAKQFTLPPHD